VLVLLQEQSQTKADASPYEKLQILPMCSHRDFTYMYGGHVFGLKSIVVPLVQSPVRQPVSKLPGGSFLFPAALSHPSCVPLQEWEN